MVDLYWFVNKSKTGPVTQKENTHCLLTAKHVGDIFFFFFLFNLTFCRHSVVFVCCSVNEEDLISQIPTDCSFGGKLLMPL